MTALLWFVGIVAAALGGTIALFRKGGPYNPTMPSLDRITEIPVTTPEAPKQPQDASSPQFHPKILLWAEAVALGEGARPELNNPGNLKYSSLTASWGGIKGRAGSDGGWLCKFPTLKAGQVALGNFLTLAAEGQLIICHPLPCSLQQFTVKYAGNPPQGYINQIAAHLGVSTATDIATFLT